ncbi:phosphoglycerate kinase [Candidatus Woesearchaeota archaeon]|nr:phosphoglycerate kinase [Candidatus Woesearchaeota archaeon]|tara:strand:- start:514 stop:1692 length:1179 start_codon:yes stop_codon:yes gene_type:complete
MNFYKLKDFDFNNKKIIVRVDFNVPLKNRKVIDDTKIRAALPTIEFLIKKKCKIILMSHLGRPKGKVIDELRLDPVAKKLSNILGKEVKKLDSCTGKEVEEAVAAMKDGDLIMLENIQFDHGEKENSKEYAEKLAKYADIYVNDGFGQCHRNYASFVAITEYLPSCAGLLVEKELNTMLPIINNPKKPYTAVVGGAKADKIETINSLLKKADKILIAGVLANTFLKAKGYNIGSSLFDEETIGLAKELADNEKIMLPVDFIIADKLDENSDDKIVKAEDIPDNRMALDIGNETVEKYNGIIKDAKTVVFFGTIGAFEIDKFSKGTEQILSAMASSEADTILGGGDSAAAADKFGLSDKMTHVSTGGGASLALFSGKELPAVKALEENYKKFK